MLHSIQRDEKSIMCQRTTSQIVAQLCHGNTIVGFYHWSIVGPGECRVMTKQGVHMISWITGLAATGAMELVNEIVSARGNGVGFNESCFKVRYRLRIERVMDAEGVEKILQLSTERRQC